jgi:hypothetical protein
MRKRPDKDTGLWLLEMPAGGLLGPVMSAAQWGQIAFACSSAPVVGEGVVIVAAVRPAAATGERAGPLPDLDEVPQGR